MSTAKLELVVTIEGTYAQNAPHLKRADGRFLFERLMRSIPVPPAACNGMYVSFAGEMHEVSGIEWRCDGDTGILVLHSMEDVRYYDQAPTAEMFFDAYVEGMIASGWARDRTFVGSEVQACT